MDTNVKQVEIVRADPKDPTADPAWYFNAIAGNGEIVSTSEFYTCKEDAKRGAEGVFPGVPQIEEDEEVKDGD